jgi:AraC family transcriptional regulator of adaptative response/methylated-DNA-[protein]-cysteine methyltransferase
LLSNQFFFFAPTDDSLEDEFAIGYLNLKARSGVRGARGSGTTCRIAVEWEMNDMNATLKELRKSVPSVADDPRWARITARDKTADGQFWYSVLSTGVYCRPSCPSRRANPGNVQLHDSLESAKATGFRPCKRCHPDGLPIEAKNAALVAKACRIIEESEEAPSLEELAGAIGRSPSYFHRMFRAATGVTPKDYAAAHRATKVRHGLASGSTVTEAIYHAGFNSSGRFYEKSTGMLGMTPSQYRSGGANEEIRFAVGQSSLGTILVASTKKGVAAILLGDDPDELVRNLQDRFQRRMLSAPTATTRAWWRRSSGSLRRRGSGWIFPLMFAAQLSRNGCGRRSRKCRPARRYLMLKLHGVSVHRTLSAPWQARVPRTNSPSPFPAIAWFATMARSLAMLGVLTASVL